VKICGLISLPIFRKQRINKFCTVKHLNLLNFFAHTNIFYGDAELVGDADNYAAFCGAI